MLLYGAAGEGGNKRSSGTHQLHSGKTSSPSPGTESNCRPLGPNTQKQTFCEVEVPVETLQPSLWSLALALPQRRSQAASSLFSLDPVPGPSWLPGWLLALAFTPKGATHKQEMLPDVMPALSAIGNPQAEGISKQQC